MAHIPIAQTYCGCVWLVSQKRSMSHLTSGEINLNTVTLQDLKNECLIHSSLNQQLSDSLLYPSHIPCSAEVTYCLLWEWEIKVFYAAMETTFWEAKELNSLCNGKRRCQPVWWKMVGQRQTPSLSSLWDSTGHSFIALRSLRWV